MPKSTKGCERSSRLKSSQRVSRENSGSSSSTIHQMLGASGWRRFSARSWTMTWKDGFTALFGTVHRELPFHRLRWSSGRSTPNCSKVTLRTLAWSKMRSLGGWPSFETFLDRGFGFTMLDGTSVVCWCTAEYVSEGKCGIGIETIEAYQRRGIATVVTGEFVRHALASGVNPHWDCWASNTPSVRVAEKMGFADMHDYKIAIGTFGDG